MSWIAENPNHYAGQRVANGHCVRYVQVCAGLPHTSQWRQGDPVRDGEVEPGTVIATFDEDGTYGNHTDGRSHAAIFCSQTAEGLLVWDQWVGHPVSTRVIRFRNGEGRAVNDGDQFCVVESAE